jgi:hypothetical protein
VLLLIHKADDRTRAVLCTKAVVVEPAKSRLVSKRERIVGGCRLGLYTHRESNGIDREKDACLMEATQQMTDKIFLSVCGK